MSEKSYIHKKRIVFTALKPYFSGDKLMQAMILWDTKYAHAPSTAVQHFVYDLKNSIDENADIRGAHLGLIRAGSLPESALLADPTVAVDRYIKSNDLAKQATFSKSEFEVLQAFVLYWRKSIDHRENQLVTAFVIENIPKQKIDPSLTMAFVSWLGQRKKIEQFPETQISDLRKIVNLIYTASCEYLGPVRSDKILSLVSQKIKQINGGRYQDIVERLL